ncbi:MAG: hypothetical protein ACR2KV_16200 [Solirubrobacteraceae bacterium]
MPRRGRIAAFALIAVLAFASVGCGSSSSTGSNGTTTNHTSFAKTKFVLHAGLAFGAFHHFIYKPFKAGELTGGGLFSHKLTKVKAGLAGLFAYHEIKLALVDAQSSPLLSKLLAPLTALSSKLQALGTRIKGGNVDAAAIESANTDVTSAGSAAQAAGQPISESTPSAAQLAGG